MSRAIKLPREETVLLARQLALAIRSGISLTQAVELIAEKTENSRLRQALEAIHADLSMGTPFSDAVKPHEMLLSPFFVQMVLIGEESGTLVEVLEQIAFSYEKMAESDSKLKTAVTYPLLLSVLMLGVIVLLIVQVMPMFDSVLRSLGSELPPFTEAILGISLAVKTHFLLILSILAALAIGLSVYYRTPTGRLKADMMKFKVPVVKGIHSSLLAARFARSLGMLIHSGMSIQQSFTLIKPTMNNLFVEEMLDERMEEVMRGDGLDEVLSRMDLFPWLLNKLFSVAAMTGQMDQALMTAADEMEKVLDRRLARLANVVEPVLVVILSLIVGVILVSVVLPVISIMNAIG